jgi:hypothetical protein
MASTAAFECVQSDPRTLKPDPARSRLANSLVLEARERTGFETLRFRAPSVDAQQREWGLRPAAIIARIRRRTPAARETYRLTLSPTPWK